MNTDNTDGKDERR